MKTWSIAKVFMILTDDCDLETIQQIATANGWHFSLMQEQKKLGEMHFIYQLSVDNKA